MGIRIQEAAFDPGAELNAFSELTEVTRRPHQPFPEMPGPQAVHDHSRR